MLSCKEITHLLSESQDRKLTLSEKMHLEMHLTMCKGCKNFKSQMSFLREACKQYVKARSKVDE
ncbi:MAG: hypothetical protein CVU16_09445 [Betaproteobacteria bacterium HGW-Betaproteobacteria-10]|nr:MAG: hypothetical protein CVU16_09445 [Betaproteobacteria bacterium HGW-Betaproteobacteria-10]